MRENQIVQRVGAAWEHSEADHTIHDLVFSHSIDLLLKFVEMGTHPGIPSDYSFQKSAGHVKVAPYANNIKEVGRSK